MKSQAGRERLLVPGFAWSISRHLFTTRPARLLGEWPWVRPLAASILAILAAAGAWTIGTALWNDAKPWLTQVLIARAWKSSLAAGRHVKPWPWADTWPVARLAIPQLGIERYVLAGGAGALGFGVRHMAGTALPGEAGNSVIGGRDETDLEFLRELPAQTSIEMESMDGNGIRYTVRYVQALDPRDVWITKQEGPPRLTLITCSSTRTPHAGELPCYGVSAFPVEEGNSPRPGPRLESADAILPGQAAAVTPSPVVDQATSSTPSQNTIFGRKTRV